MAILLTEKIKHLTNIVGNFKEGQMYNYDNGIRNTLKEEIEQDEMYLRVNAIHRIKLIATILGIEGIKT